MKNEWPQISEQEALEIQKEMFMTGGGVKIGQTMEQYKTEREEIWNRMHPKKEQSQTEEVSETPANGENSVNSESALDSIDGEELHTEAVEKQKLKDETDLNRIRQELGLPEVFNVTNKRESVAMPEATSDNMYEDIANKIPINDKRPPLKNMPGPVVGNMFGENDKQTLAGRTIADEIYNTLVNRSDYKSALTVQEVIQLGKVDLEDFKKYIEQLNSKRMDGEAKFRFDINRPGGTTGFHLDGDETVSRGHLFYFNKTTAEWKNPNEQQVRAYITTGPEERDIIQRHFVDLCKKLYDAGIDFMGKASGPNGLEKRTDNIVLYITASDQAKAGELIKEFLQERGIGQGHVSAAIPSPEDGLSWAPEPSEQDVKLWQEVSGSSERASFNTVIATKVAPMFMRRVAEAHQKLGNQTEAEAFNTEAARIEEIMKKS